MIHFSITLIFRISSITFDSINTNNYYSNQVTLCLMIPSLLVFLRIQGLRYNIDVGFHLLLKSEQQYILGTLIHQSNSLTCYSLWRLLSPMSNRILGAMTTLIGTLKKWQKIMISWTYLNAWECYVELTRTWTKEDGFNGVVNEGL